MVDLSMTPTTIAGPTHDDIRSCLISLRPTFFIMSPNNAAGKSASA